MKRLVVGTIVGLAVFVAGATFAAVPGSADGVKALTLKAAPLFEAKGPVAIDVPSTKPRKVSLIAIFTSLSSINRVSCAPAVAREQR